MSGTESLRSTVEGCPTGGEASDDRGMGCGARGVVGVESAQNQPMGGELLYSDFNGGLQQQRQRKRKGIYRSLFALGRNEKVADGWW